TRHGQPGDHSAFSPDPHERAQRVPAHRPQHRQCVTSGAGYHHPSIVPVHQGQIFSKVASVRHDYAVTKWEYARLEYRSAGTTGTDKYMDWDAIFYQPEGAQRWGTDERFDDLRHLNRAGAEGWQAYDRAALMIGQPLRLYALTYSMRRPIN